VQFDHQKHPSEGCIRTPNCISRGSAAADGASLGIDRVALMNFVSAVAEKGARHASQSEFRSLRGKLARSSSQ
jgi:hypothetical protein